MKKMMRMGVLALALSPLASLAAPPDAASSAERQQRMEKHEKRVRMTRVLGLTEELGLEAAQAVKLDETLRKFDERRRPLRQQVREAAEVIRQAAEGDAAAQGQVDAAIQRVFDARSQLAALDKEMFQTLSKDLTPQKRAKMALFLARSGGMKRSMGHGDGPQQRKGPRRERRHGLGGAIE